jgi:hypothetical protein
MMRNKIITFSLAGIGILLLLILGASAAIPSSYNGKVSFYKTSQDKTTRTLSNIMNWSYWQYHDGTSGIEPAQSSGGGIYPRGTGNVVFQDGLVWGTIINGKIQVGGGTYNVGTQPGWIEGTTAVDANHERARLYRIRADWQTVTAAQVLQDAAELNVVQPAEVTEDMTDAVIAQYAADWKDWPVDLGAPFVDKNQNGTYDPVLDNDGYPTTDGDYPGIAEADQVMWYVVNDQDAGAVNALYGSDPIGVELQRTIWGYAQPSARLGQIIFIKHLFINKSNDVFDSMYVAQWCDPDVGGSGNDLVGCDSTLGLGFAYNADPTDGTFDQFGLTPPAMGYDFFQGPFLKGVAGQDKNNNGVDDAEDYAIRFLKKVGPGYINLPMTSFGYFSAGNVEWEDPELEEYQGTLEWYNLLRGNITNTYVLDPTPFTHRDNNQPTKWPLNGDPVAGTGDVDGTGANFSAADRRMALCSGPFVMQPGDTQEVVVALIGGISDNNLLAVSEVKETDKVAQQVFDELFAGIPKAPPAPKVEIYPDEEGIVLNWGFDAKAIAATEKTVTAGYSFEGYNVYQLPTFTATRAEAEKIATFDAINGVTTIYGKVFDPTYGEVITVPVQFGKDFGIQRYLNITKNAITQGPLYPGNEYYFAVTAYNYNEDPQLIEDMALESPLTPLTVRTQSPPPGVRYEEVDSDVEVTHSEGSSDGQVEVKVVDPSKLTGHQYEIYFTENMDSTIAEVGEILFSVRDVTTGTVMAENQSQNSAITDNRGPVVDGVLVKVAGPPNDWKKFECVANAAGPIDPPEIGCFAFNANGFPFLYNSLYPDGTDRPDGARQQTNGSTWGLHTGGTTYWLYEEFIGRSMRAGWSLVVPWDFEMRFTAEGGYGIWAFENGGTYRVPFELWNTGINTPDDPSDDFRLVPWVLNDTGEAPDDSVYNINPSDHALSGGTNDPYMDWVYWLQPRDISPGEAGYNQSINESIAGTYAYDDEEIFARTVLVNWNGGDVADATFPDNLDAVIPEEGTIFRFTSTKPNSVSDKFTFTSSTVSKDEALAKKDIVDKITVYPNPYYAFNPQEPDRFTRFVTFYHLPPVTSTDGNPFATKTTIRIFDLSGVLVRTLEKSDNSQFLRWDIRNEANLPIASGIYFAHIDMPDLGAEKILKIFIVQPAQILRFY